MTKPCHATSLMTTSKHNSLLANLPKPHPGRLIHMTKPSLLVLFFKAQRRRTPILPPLILTNSKAQVPQSIKEFAFPKMTSSIISVSKPLSVKVTNQCGTPKPEKPHTPNAQASPAFSKKKRILKQQMLHQPIMMLWNAKETLTSAVQKALILSPQPLTS